MQCPKLCDAKLSPIERNGVTVDVCPSCRGVWLDRGELDRILDSVYREEKEAHPQQPIHAAPPPRPDYYRQPGYDDRMKQERYGYYHHDDDDHYKRAGYKKKPMWKNLMDILD